MPAKIRPSDWDRYFSPRAPKRGGPMTVLIQLVILIGGLAGIAYGLDYGLGYADERKENATATAVAQGTATIEAQGNAAATAEALGATATAEIVNGVTGVVLTPANLRTEPRVADDTLIGQVAPGDALLFLGQRVGADGLVWYRVKTTSQTSPEGQPIGTEGWISSTLVSEPSGAVPSE